MDAAGLQALGLMVHPGSQGPEGELVFQRAELVNPITRQRIDSVRFGVVEGRLVPVAPPALTRLATFGPAPAEVLEERMAESFHEAVSHLQRRSAELQALGLSPQVNPETLELGAELTFDDQRVQLAADRRGVFSVTAVTRGGRAVPLAAPAPFELSEFKDKGGLVGFVSSLVGVQAAEGGVASRPAEGAALETAVTLEDLQMHLGAEARVPPQTPIEVLVVMESEGQRYRFAAARVQGRTFRGLLAGPKGKLWSGRFELDQFPGIPALTAQVLRVEPGQVRVLPRGES